MLVGLMEYETNENGLLVKRKGKGLIKAFPDDEGYLKYALSQNGKTFNVRVHRVVWEFFNGPIPEGMTIDHIDDDNQNNNIANLQLLTPIDNVIKGNAKHWKVCSPDGVWFEVYNLEAFCRGNELNAATMRDIARGKINQHKGWECRE